ncbi:MAG: hypothetical protein KatS3mg047_1037 [Bellilinea sp.]|nr:MAG: hypothetical protein KatS3mg047_1037 [Bellilinea sp.]
MLIYETDTQYILEHENIRIIADKKQCPADYVSYLQSELENAMAGAKSAQRYVEVDGKLVAVEEPPKPRLTEWSKWQIIREKRDRLLAESDWTQIPDTQLDDKKRSEWRAYRQALRDLPQAYRRADEVVWPECPK